jgi:High potential iron-sulfur protein
MTTMKPSRRIFVLQSLTGAGALAALAVSNVAQSQVPAVVVDTDPQATALGYKTDGTKADVKKYPGYTSAQSCAACVLFQGKATDTTGGCAVFGNKLVASKGWCSAWAKKAA